MINCINLCEVLFPNLLNQFSLKAIIKRANLDVPIKRIYIGSSFCSQYFIHLSSFLKNKLFEEETLPITLTLPIFSQKDLSLAKKRIDELVTQNNSIDEITVNDLGMFEFIKSNFDCRINLGRLFFKDPRDIRISEYNSQPISLSLLDHIDYYEGISGIEFDQITQNIQIKPKNKLIFGVHVPYTFQTTGNICKFASIHKKSTAKFRPNSRCSLECEHIHEYFTEKFNNSNQLDELFRLGRTVYFLQKNTNIDNLKIDRKIIFPLKELSLLGDRYANSSSI